jgi:hypothetical protein
MIEKVGAGPSWRAAQYERDQLPGLQVPLEPPGSLPDQTPQLNHALLVYRNGRAVLIAPAGRDQAYAQVEVVGKAPGPGSGPSDIIAESLMNWPFPPSPTLPRCRRPRWNTSV